MALAANQLKAFAGLDQALGRLILRDPRSRKEISEAAGINASMLSGYCSGRRVPSVEHLDRILTTLGVGIEELTYELRAVDYRAQSAPLVVWPKFMETREGGAAAELLTGLLEQLHTLVRTQGTGPGPEPAAPKGAAKKTNPPRRRGAAGKG